MKDSDAWPLRRARRCICCHAIPRVAYSTVLDEAMRERLGFDVVITCQSHYCRDRAARGAV